jgi:H+/Cl- antiporter ClcA
MSSSTNMSFYDYDPSTALAGVVAGLYGVAFIASIFHTIRKRSWVWTVMVLAILSTLSLLNPILDT